MYCGATVLVGECVGVSASVLYGDELSTGIYVGIWRAWLTRGREGGKENDAVTKLNALIDLALKSNESKNMSRKDHDRLKAEGSRITLGTRL